MINIEIFTTILLWGLLSAVTFAVFAWISGHTWQNSISIGKRWIILYRWSTKLAWTSAGIFVLDIVGWILVISKSITDLLFI